MASDDELRALLSPETTLRLRTRFLAIAKPVVAPLRELAPATDDPVERELIAALDDAALPVYADWLEQHGELARARWVRAYPDGDLLAATRFGGTPAALRGERWPGCTCGAPLQFVGQVSGADAAEPAWYALFTFFFCWHCWRCDSEQDCGGPERPYRGWVVRAYPEAPLDELVRLEPPTDELLFFEGYVRGVREKSLPHYMHYITRIHSDDLARFDTMAYELTDRPGHGERAHPMPRNAGLAIGGYPYWYNGPDETPRCSACTSEMELLLQLDPHDAVEGIWGDTGTLFVFSCARHRDVFALRMQST